MENEIFVDQKRQAVCQFLAEHAALLSRQGSVQTSWRRYRGKTLGPFFRLSFRQGNVQRSYYLGSDPALAEEIRRLLEKLQAPRRDQRQQERQLLLLRAAFRQQKNDFRQELQALGLDLKGSEIRGWRSRRAGQEQAQNAQAEARQS